jgi:hypothetical protein
MSGVCASVAEQALDERDGRYLPQAIGWSGIARVVFGIGGLRMRVFRGEHAGQREAGVSCRDVFAASPHPVECIGAAMLQCCKCPASRTRDSGNAEPGAHLFDPSTNF